MSFDKFSIKAQEEVQEAVNIAQRNVQQTIEPVHLLSGILEKSTGISFAKGWEERTGRFPKRRFRSSSE